MNEILQRIIRVSSNPGDTVLDPSMGSGAAGVEALREDRKYIGIEQDGGYYARAKEWIGNDMPQMPLGGVIHAD